MPDVTGPPVTFDGNPVSGALVVVIHNETGDVLDWTTTDADGNWTASVAAGQDVQPLIKYRDADGNLHQEYNRPYVVVESALLEEATNRWDFNSTDAGSTTVVDQVGTNDLTITGASWIAEGYSGNGLSFDGTDDYANTQSGITSNAEETYAILARGVDPNATDGILLTHGRTWAYGDLNVAFDGRVGQIDEAGEVDFREYRWQGSVSRFASGGATTTDWHLYSVSIDETGTNDLTEFYLDGALVASGAGQPYGGDETAPVYLGSDPDPGQFAAVDISFAIRYDRYLTASEHSDLNSTVQSGVS